jgi:hypothetical protein
VPDDELSENRVQQRTLNFILGNKQEGIKDLISSFTTNGFLDIDQIQVKAIGDKYVALEGNRRTATLKYLWEEFKKGNDVGVLTENSFKSINLVEILDEDPVQHLISMGLHHISGKKRWSAVNEAQLISDLIYKYLLTEDEVCNKLGISKYLLRRSVRTLSLIEQYKESDFGDQFEAEKYTIFQTAIGSPDMRGWLGWNDDDYWAEEIRNVERFFSWISQTEEVEENDERKDKIIKEPIITQYRQLTDVIKFINDDNALDNMEKSRSISEAYAFSKSVGEAKLKDAINSIKGSVQLAYNFKELVTANELRELMEAKEGIENLLPENRSILLSNEKLPQPFFDDINSHFTSSHILNYRKLADITISNISRVNLFAGGNNKGKTTVLESCFF